MTSARFIGLVLRALGFGLGDPSGHDRRVSACIECGPVLRELAVAFWAILAAIWSPPSSGCIDGVRLRRVPRWCRPGGVGSNLLREPGVERREARLGEGDVQRVADAVGEGVLAGEPAAVVRCGVGPVALHPPVADAAEQQAAQRVGRAWSGVACARPGRPGARSAALGLLEGLVVDDRRVDGLVGEIHLSGSFQRILVRWPRATSSTSSRTSSLRCRFQTWRPVYRGLSRMAGTADFDQAIPQRCRLRAGSCADGQGMPSAVRRSAMA